MKKLLTFLLAAAMLLSLTLSVSAQAVAPTDSNLYGMRIALISLLIILAVLIIFCIVLTVICVKRGKGGGMITVTILCYVVTVIVLACILFCGMAYRGSMMAALQAQNTEPPETTAAPTTEATEPPTEPTEPDPTLAPAMTDNSNPETWKVKWELIDANGIVESFQRTETISFGKAENYYPLPGIPTFRGDNYRTGATYGLTQITEEKMESLWSVGVGSLGGWPGVGWTGQPLVVKWDEETKQIMNLYDEKKAKADLVEVICTTLDGYIYFLDLDDGTYTRDPMYLGMSVKGTGALDPRGYPLMFAGSGLNQGQSPRMYAISLIDTTILWEQSGSDGYNLRGWCGFDGSALISGETDTLLWGGENGLLYTIKLNTQYDKQAGTISVNPENVLRTRYTTQYTDRYLGYESSILAVENYAFIGDNAGFMFCVDLNTMELVWAQFTGDDINATPVFEWGDDGIGYLYTATSADYGGGVCKMHKINANTGEIIWEKEYTGIVIDKDASKGVLSSPVLGKPGTDLEGMIIHTIGGTPSGYSGILVALNTVTGEVIWEKTLDYYAWSSIAGLYTAEGKGYLALGDAGGNMMLFDGKTGEKLDTLNLGSNMEASPVVYENTLVIGTRGQRIYGVRFK